MRWPPLALALVLAGCMGGGGPGVDLEARCYDIGGPKSICCTGGGGFYKDVECSDGRVHRINVHVMGLAESDVGVDRWRLVWDDGHRTGVAVAHAGEGVGGTVQAALGACTPSGAQIVAFVELQDVNGERIGRAAMPVLGG